MEIIKRLSLAEVYKFYPSAPGDWSCAVLDDENPMGYKNDDDVLEDTAFFIGFYMNRFVLCNVGKNDIAADATEVASDVLDQVSFFDVDSNCWEPLDY